MQNSIYTADYYNMASLQELKTSAKNNDEATLRAVATQLESVFLHMILKNMKAGLEPLKSQLFSRQRESFYEDMLNHQLSLSLSKSGGIGLAEMIINQVKRMKGESEVKNRPISFNGINSIKEKTFKVEEKTNDKSNENNEEVDKITNIDEFIRILLPLAKGAAELIGVDPKLLLAQSALETGWGSHMAADEKGEVSYNLFGIKANKHWQGKAVNSTTLEYEAEKVQKTKAPFKAYGSYVESFLDYIKLLKSTRYQKALEKVKEPLSFLQELTKAGYATDPHYTEKVFSIYQSDFLQKGVKL